LSEAVAVRRLRPLAPLTPWSKNVAALELAANDYITLRRQFRGFEKPNSCDVERDCRDGLH
jgi:Tripartite tricarboxylate transporter family receptor